MMDQDGTLTAREIRRKRLVGLATGVVVGYFASVIFFFVMNFSGDNVAETFADSYWVESILIAVSVVLVLFIAKKGYVVGGMVVAVIVALAFPSILSYSTFLLLAILSLLGIVQ